VRILGIPDRIVEHGSPKELQQESGYDAQAIAAAAREMLGVELGRSDEVRVAPVVRRGAAPPG
jgi:hypothetical protein